MLFQGDVHSYGLIYNNNFELSREIITFTDILEHKETIFYLEDGTKELIGKKEHPHQPTWLTDTYGEFVYMDENQAYLQFLERFIYQNQDHPDKAGIFEELRRSISNFKSRSTINSKDKKRFIESLMGQQSKHGTSKNVSLSRWITSQMILLDKDIFLKNSAFAVNFIVNLTDCQREKNMASSKIFSTCFPNSQKVFNQFKVEISDNPGHPQNLSSMILRNFLYEEPENEFNPLILYRFNLEQIKGKEAAHETVAVNSKSSKMHQQVRAGRSAKDLGISSSINPIVSPSLFIKQVTQIRHFYGDLFLVITKKTLLSIYDLKNKAVYYLFRIQETNLSAKIHVVGREFFAVLIKANASDDEFFKVLIFQFYEESMSIKLVNRKSRLIQFVQADLMAFPDCIYLITLKLNFFGLIVYKFPLNIRESGNSIQEVEVLTNHNQMWLNKNVISIDSRFSNLIIVENYISQIKNFKIKCRKNIFRVINCVLQSNHLDNLLVTLRLAHSNFPKSKRERFLEGNQPKQFFKPVESALTEKLKSSIKENMAQKIQKMFKLKKKQRETTYVNMEELKLIRNEYAPGLVQMFTTYFYKQFLILVYQVDSLLRIYFYNLSIPNSQPLRSGSTSKSSSDEKAVPESTGVNYCASNIQKKYKSMFYRVEVKMKKSKFLYLRFGYDLESRSIRNLGSEKEREVRVQDIVKVVFDNRIEHYVLNGNLKVTLKKKILDFDQISVFAKNHNRVANGRGSVNRQRTFRG